MKNEEAIKAIKANYPSGGYEDLCEALDMAIKALEDSRWIPITERLPDKEGDYFTTKINDFDEPILGMTYYRKEWGWSTSYKITAWMPLPEHYEEGAEG